MSGECGREKSPDARVSSSDLQPCSTDSTPMEIIAKPKVTDGELVRVAVGSKVGTHRRRLIELVQQLDLACEPCCLAQNL